MLRLLVLSLIYLATSNHSSAQINCPENLPMTLVGNTEYCVGSPGAELSIPEIYDGYEWLPTSETTSQVLLTAGNYQVVVTHYTGCTDTIDFEVEQVPNPPQPTITASGSVEICEGESVVLSGPEGYPYYEWSSGSVTPSVTVYETGNYVLSIRDWLGCESSSNLITVVVNPQPQAAFSTGIEMFDLDLNNLSTDATSYEWNFGDGSTSTDFEPSHTFSTEGIIEMYLVASNDCGSDTAFFNLTSVGIDDNSELTSITLFPNPATDFLNINFSQRQPQVETVTIYSLDGKIVRRLNKAVKVIDVSKFPQGTYFLEVVSGDSKWTKLFNVLR